MSPEKQRRLEEEVTQQFPQQPVSVFHRDAPQSKRLSVILSVMIKRFHVR